MAMEMIGTADRRGIIQSLEPVESRRIHYRAVAPRSGNARSGNDNIKVSDACFLAWEDYRRDKRNHPDEYEVRAFVAAFEAVASAKPATRASGTFRQGVTQGKAEAEAEIAAVLTEYGGDAPGAGQTVAGAVRRLVATLTDPTPAQATTGATTSPLTVETALRGCRLSELLGEIRRRHEEAERIYEQRHAGDLATKDGEIATLRDEVAALKPDAERFRQARALFGAA